MASSLFLISSTGSPLTPESWTLLLMGMVGAIGTSELRYLELSGPTSSQLTWPCCPTPLHVEVMERYLRTHPDPSLAAYITHGLHNGFHIGYSYGSFHLRSHGYNHPSLSANAATVQTHIHTELSAGRLVEPLVSLAQRHVHVSPIGLVPKGHTGTR